MQFIEKNSFNVRSAVYRLKRDGSALEFLIFPTIHVGSPEFYDEIPHAEVELSNRRFGMDEGF